MVKSITSVHCAKTSSLGAWCFARPRIPRLSWRCLQPRAKRCCRSCTECSRSQSGTAWRAAGHRLAAVEDVAQRVQTALRESVARHLVADVPVGVFLSGGIDSGAVVGLMVEAGARELEGVTIAYDEFAGRHEDEAPVAAGLAVHYGI